MQAMLLHEITTLDANPMPLQPGDLPVSEPAGDEIIVNVATCGVCHTDIDVIEGRTPPGKLPLVPGHQVVGRVVGRGREASRFREGDRVGVAWIYSSCGECHFCSSGRENLCGRFRATGRDADGGYAEYLTVSEKFAYALPAQIGDAEAAPLLCAGAIGYRALRLSGVRDGDPVGLVGFGASGHIVLKLVRKRYPASRVYVFSRTAAERSFALELGAVWAGGLDDVCPEQLQSAIDTTPAWGPVVSVLRNLEKGGRLVINAIRKEDADKRSLLSIDYPRDLWLEKELKSVANITRRDVEEFLRLAVEAGIRPHVQEYPLADANRALLDLKERRIRGAKVLRVAAS